MSHWAEQTIWWHVYPLGFTGAPLRPRHDRERILSPRLERLLAWLDYLQTMGANGLALGPIFASDSHGYDTLDFFRIDPRLGSQTEFDRLMRACDERGIAVMLDGVFNHVSHRHPLFRAALSGDPVAARYFRMHRGRPASPATTAPETAQANDIPPSGHPSYDCFEGHYQLPALNHDSDEVLQLVKRVMQHWLDRGARAWRLDAAHAVPAHFWQRLLPAVRQRHPETWFVGEMLVGDFIALVHDTGLDSTTQYHLWHSARHSLQHADFGDLEHCLDRHNQMLEHFTPLTFVGNHDVVRLASQIGSAKAALAFTLQMSVGGSPCIYYGDEQVFGGNKRSGDELDDELRPAYPDSPGQLPGAGRWMYAVLQNLNRLRQANPWLPRARTRILWRHAQGIGYRVQAAPTQWLDVQLLLTPQPHARIEREGVCLLHVAPPVT